MNSISDKFEHTASSLSDITEKLKKVDVEIALLKILPKNANDKNQIYIASDFGILYDIFSLTISERGPSTSLKDGPQLDRQIPEASFDDFAWVKQDGTIIPAKRVKAIIYPQYPEARLSGLQTIDNEIPASLSITFTKSESYQRRLLVLGKTPNGGCRAFVFWEISDSLAQEISNLPGFPRSSVCKQLIIENDNASKLEKLLIPVLGNPLRGCRLDVFGNTIPFTGTQVCGYTLEHALNIVPNAGKEGDLYGIELKTHTQLKITLFTPEPDLGLYADDFTAFMKKYGYVDSEGNYRLTGIHRANVKSSKSGLTMRMREYGFDENESWVSKPYNPDTPLTSKLDAIEVTLEDSSGFIAAGWSLQRLMNSWGVKHNEAVYIHANKETNPDSEEFSSGFEYLVTFSRDVMWCKQTSAEKMLKAIFDGIIFLDPAPKLNIKESSKSKRRAQWRVNDIKKAAPFLYSFVELRKII
ncbi:MAG: MvaI/BcnI family restriction endonuclease [Burkholderia gladioli]